MASRRRNVRGGGGARAPRAVVMGFTDEQLRACVLDGGTRFVAPRQVTTDMNGRIRKVSDERNFAGSLRRPPPPGALPGSSRADSSD